MRSVKSVIEINFLSVIFVITVIITVVCFVGCESKSKEDNVESNSYIYDICNKNNIKFSLIKDSNITELKNTIGGFHGDGQLAYKVIISENEVEQVEKTIKDNWNSGKLSKDVEIIMYGGDNEGTEYMGYAEEIGIPKVKGMYWNVKSEHDGSLLENNYDFTFAMYDAGEKTIYLFENHI